MNNHERSFKWLPFNSLIPLNNLKDAIQAEKNITTYPLLSEDELNTLQNNLLNAYHTKEEVTITYFYQHTLYHLQGIITTINYPKKLIILNKTTKLYFNQITHISLSGRISFN